MCSKDCSVTSYREMMRQMNELELTFDAFNERSNFHLSLMDARLDAVEANIHFVVQQIKDKMSQVQKITK